MPEFRVKSVYSPAGDQPEAIEKLLRAGINKTRETFTISGRIRAHRRNRYSQSDELPLDMDVDAGPHEMPVDIPDDNERD